MRLIVFQNNNLNNRGVTLVEVMIALVIMLIVFMGLIQASVLSINSNLRNEIRDDSVRMVSEQMSVARSLPYNTLIAGAAACPVPIPTPPNVAPNQPYAFSSAAVNVTRGVRNLTRTYTVWRSVCLIDATTNNAYVSIMVDYAYPDQAASVNRQAVTSVIKRP